MDASGSPASRDRLRQARLKRQWRQRDVADQLGTTVVTVNRWERGLRQPNAYFQLKLCALFGKSAEELGLISNVRLVHQESMLTQTLDSPRLSETGVPSSIFGPAEPRSHDHENISQPLLWNVPFRRNPFFTGREQLLQRLHEGISQRQTIALTQSYALSGLGGIGKTQIAIEYAYRYAKAYIAIFWVPAETRETLLTGLAYLADLLQIPEKDVADQQKRVEAVHRWFATHHQWLLILDNLEDAGVLHAALPPGGDGSVLLTTRLQALGSLAQCLDVEYMTLEEGTRFLLLRSKRLTLQSSLNQVSSDEYKAAQAMVIAMDGLPLALDQAGAYLEETHCSVASYQEKYRIHRAELLGRRGTLGEDHPHSVTTTLLLCFEQVKQRNPLAADVLRLCAFLEPDAIPEELISEGSTHLGPTFSSIAMNALQLDEAIQELRMFSLIQRNPETRLLSVHRLVQAILKDTMEPDEQCQWAVRAVRATNAVFPQTVDIVTWPRCRRFLSQAQVCAALIRTSAFAFPEAALLLYRTACYLEDFAFYEQAEPLLQRARSIWEQALEPEHSTVTPALTRLAKLYFEQNKYEQAEPLYQRALHIQEHTLGPEHPDVASSLNGLANLHRAQGKYQQAEPLFQRALHIQERTLGPEHPDAASSLNGLAHLYSLQGKYQQAEPLYQRALHIQEHTLGPEHPDTAFSLNGLANLYREQGKYQQAELLFQRALSIWEKELGPEHPHVARASNNLANIYYEQGKYDQAKLLYQRAQSIWEQTLGPEHPAVALPLNNLASLYLDQRKYQQAEFLYQRALHIQEQAFGSEHWRIADSLNYLANLYLTQKKYQQAEPLFQRALYIREQVFGPEHWSIADSLGGLANLYREQKKYQQAEPLYQRALHIREQDQPSHPELATLFSDIAAFQQAQNDYQAAATLYQRALAIQKQSLHAQHPVIVATQKAYAEALQLMTARDEGDFVNAASSELDKWKGNEGY